MRHTYAELKLIIKIFKLFQVFQTKSYRITDDLQAVLSLYASPAPVSLCLFLSHEL